ncbi:WD40 repeat domain-containing serine/threonine-protein kinase [Allocoleopsis franciscana]|uniref:WD40 repeat-containing protein n=1 Tax=Allocoleopsis franciscana PCC 7113 TaxID=1173027 RepID=K9WIW8_9CYAN|nr:WD40 repeat domain-containing serine/threonine-protein kinase [Allocoleopsis franciscana]AFZ19751.1 WD40 repeat-containing protein [Allocoleopsis franciscana PCC 7113]
MSYCLNPKCQKPQNPSNAKFCSTCGARLLLGDRYRALQLVSQGGIGRTFLAIDEHDSSQSRCIIKQLSPQNQGTHNPTKAIELFRQEVTRLMELRGHPQIPQLLAYFESQEPRNTGGMFTPPISTPTLVHTWIEGQSLAQQLEAEGAFSETQIRQILTELLPVLQFVHDRSVIHRDINPENIIRRPSDRQLVLVDFSAAKFTSKTALRKTGTLIGSAAYTAPEQLMGKAETSSDLYSLAVTCIHLLTHIHPFDLFNSLEGIWVWQDYLTNPVSDSLCQILNKMLEGAVKNRYPSAQDILNDLTPDAKTKIWVKSAQVTSCSSPTAPISLIPTWHCVRTLTGHHSSIHGLAFRGDGTILASSSADRTVKLWNPDRRIPRATLSGHSSLIEAIAWTPDGRILVSGSWDYAIKIWDVETAELIHTFCAHSGWIKSLAISPDAKILVSASADRTIKLWNLQTKELQNTLCGHSGAVHCVAISSDGQTLASGGADQTIKIWDLDNPEVQQTLEGHADTVNTLTFSPSGQFLISGSADQTIKIWDLRNKMLPYTLDGHSGAINSIVINAQGDLLISGSADKTVKIWHPSSGKQLYTLCEHSAGVTAVAIHSNSGKIASGSQDKTIKIWQFELL